MSAHIVHFGLTMFVYRREKLVMHRMYGVVLVLKQILRNFAKRSCLNHIACSFFIVEIVVFSSVLFLAMHYEEISNRYGNSSVQHDKIETRETKFLLILAEQVSILSFTFLK